MRSRERNNLMDVAIDLQKELKVLEQKEVRTSEEASRMGEIKSLLYQLGIALREEKPCRRRRRK